MSGVQALPLVRAFSESEKPDERAVFVRVSLNLISETARRGVAVPEDWLKALQTCLENAGAAERNLYLAGLAKAHLRARPSSRERAVEPFAFATREDIDAILISGRLEWLIALAADRKARLRPEHVETLVSRAQALAGAGDRRLLDALLSRNGLRLEAAPLFLEATSAQRLAILVAAQRAVLGRRAPRAPRLDADAAARLEYAAIAGDGREFAAALAAALGADPALAARIGADPTGEPLAVALIALGAPRDVAVRVMTARDMQDGAGYPRIQTLARLSDRVSVPAARRIMAAMLGQPTAGQEAAALPAAAPRTAADPSPFPRREGSRASASPETTARWARDSRRP